MILITGTVRLHADKLDAARPHLRALIEATRREDGCIAYSYSEDLETPGLIHVFEIWRDGEALHAHHNAPHFLAWRADRETLGMSDRRMSRHEVSSSQET